MSAHYINVLNAELGNHDNTIQKSVFHIKPQRKITRFQHLHLLLALSMTPSSTTRPAYGHEPHQVLIWREIVWLTISQNAIRNISGVVWSLLMCSGSWIHREINACPVWLDEQRRGYRWKALSVLILVVSSDTYQVLLMSISFLAKLL